MLEPTDSSCQPVRTRLALIANIPSLRSPVQACALFENVRTRSLDLTDFLNCRSHLFGF
jgi:hypothetical protein